MCKNFLVETFLYFSGRNIEQNCCKKAAIVTFRSTERSLLCMFSKVVVNRWGGEAFCVKNFWSRHFVFFLVEILSKIDVKMQQRSLRCMFTKVVVNCWGGEAFCIKKIFVETFFVVFFGSKY